MFLRLDAANWLTVAADETTFPRLDAAKWLTVASEGTVFPRLSIFHLVVARFMT
jgi:hypothetical protein